MRSACAIAVRFVLSIRVPLSLVVKTGVLSSRGDLSFGFLPWEALEVREVEVLSGGFRPLTRTVTVNLNLQSAKSPLDYWYVDVVKGVVVKVYFVEVAYYVSPCYEVESFKAIGCLCTRVCEQSVLCFLIRRSVLFWRVLDIAERLA